MINQKIVKIIKYVLFSVVSIAIFVLGYAFGDGIRAVSQNNTLNTEQTVYQDTKIVDSKWVKEFLIAYYTKKTLEENRNRYKAYMTDGLYKAVISEENKASNQAYKGYIVDQVFDNASIYINHDKKEILTTVSYSSTLLAVKNDYSKKTNNTTTETIRLTYVIKDDKALIDNMENMILEIANTQNGNFRKNTPKADEKPKSSSTTKTTTTTSTTKQSVTTTTTKKSGGN